MRVGIIGEGPAAILLAKKIYELEGSPVLFLKGELNFFEQFPVEVRTSSKEVISLATLLEDYLSPCEFQSHKHCSVKRIGKKFLRRDEQLPGRSRLADLFRITYAIDPKEGVLKQVEENPEVFEKLGEDVITSLNEPIEMAEDIDILVDAREEIFHPGLNGSGAFAALNELKWKSSLFYGILNKKEREKLSGKLFVNIKSACYTDYVVALLNECWENLDSLVIITNDGIKLDRLVDRDQREWDAAAIDFHEKMTDWKKLEDYEKVKVKKPSEPVHKLRIFRNYEVMSVDKLLDRDEFFFTCEFSDFTGTEDLKTFGVNYALCFTTNEPPVNFSDQEPGYYTILDNFLVQNHYRFDLVEKRVNSIIDSILGFFKKVKDV